MSYATNYLLLSSHSIFTLFHYPSHLMLITLITVGSYFHIAKSYNHFSIFLFNLSSMFNIFCILSSLKHLQLGLGNPEITRFCLTFQNCCFSLLWYFLFSSLNDSVFQNSVLGYVLFSVHIYSTGDPT